MEQVSRISPAHCGSGGPKHRAWSSGRTPGGGGRPRRRTARTCWPAARQGLGLFLAFERCGSDANHQRKTGAGRSLSWTDRVDAGPHWANPLAFRISLMPAPSWPSIPPDVRRDCSWRDETARAAPRPRCSRHARFRAPAPGSRAQTKTSAPKGPRPESCVHGAQAG